MSCQYGCGEKVPLFSDRISAADKFPAQELVMYTCYLSFRSEQPDDSGVGGKSAERGECRPSGLRSPHPAFLPSTGQKPLPHRTTGPSHVIAGM